MNIYYLIWSNAIIRFKKANPARKDWKRALFVMVTIMFGLDFWIILLWLKFFKIFELKLPDINLFPGEMLDGFLGFISIFCLPFALINYFLIFHNNRYERIIEKYKNNTGNYAFIHSMITLGLTLASAITYGILTN